MSLSSINLKHNSNSSLVEKILEQGQRLRNSMVQAVLNNDPFNKEILLNASPCTNFDTKISNTEFEKHNDPDRVRIHRYLRGDEMCPYEEAKALGTIRNMSPNSLVQSTSCFNHKNVYHSHRSCDICKDYENKILSNRHNSASTAKSDTHYSVKQSYEIKKHQEKQQIHETQESTSKLNLIRETFQGNQNILRYVDSIKINVYSLKLNNAGNKKISAVNTNKPYVVSQTYFVAYTLPDILVRAFPKTLARVNTGLSPDKTVRFCSKKIQGDSIYFKQQSIHQIANVAMLDLTSIKLSFKISFRSVKQKTALLIGIASINLGSVITNQYLTTEQDLVVMSENAPVVLGNLKVSIQFGCDKLYFGKEFIDAINCSKENTNLSDNDSFHEPKSNNKRSKIDNILVNTNENIIPNPNNQETLNRSNTITEKETPRNYDSARTQQTQNNDDTQVLYALIYISEVRLLTKPIDSYLICRGFIRDDTIISKTILNNFNPVFDLYQIIPILLDEDFINRLRDNYIIIEVWEKKEDLDWLIGLTKLSVHQLYIAYRNPVIVGHLARNPYPVTGVDWWEPIINPGSNSETGQLRALVALGTQAQIEALETKRGLRQFIERTPHPSKSIYNFDENFPASSSHSIPNPITTISEPKSDEQKSETTKSIIVSSKKTTETPKTVTVFDKYVQEPEIELVPSVVKLNEIVEKSPETIDASTQSEMNSETNDNHTPLPTATSTAPQRDFLNSFIEQLLTTRDLAQRNKHVETSTNTEPYLVPSTPNLVTSVALPTVTTPTTSVTNAPGTLRNTSDLLTSLHKALDVSSVKIPQKQTEEETCLNCGNEQTFKAHIIVENALHLPVRKKCKAKRNRGKHSKDSQDILPSTYVTFKGKDDKDCFVTPVIPKSTNPKWDFRCDIQLPVDLLLNNQKRQIFKVWRKASGPSLHPNFQTDIVLGFAALDLTVLLSGLPAVQGWFNIVDFSTKCNGQIKINVTPLENISHYKSYQEFSPVKPVIPFEVRSEPELTPETIDDSAPSELLSRTLKRKFTELDEITQRLRQRLTAVTEDESPNDSNDEFADEFERDLNTECNEELDEIADAFNMAESIKIPDISTSSATSISDSNLSITIKENNKLTELDTHLTEGKMKIDSLLEKLTLLTSDTENQNQNRSFSSRYVSGCSINQDTAEIVNNNDILKQIGLHNDPNLDPDLVFNPILFQKMYSASIDSTPRLDSLDTPDAVHRTSLKDLIGGSSSSSSSSTSCLDLSHTRPVPDGAGHLSSEHRF